MIDTHDLTILFVDDEESILDVLAEFFRRKKYGVVTARNGQEALAVLDNQRVDCCFTDINMPVMDGLELAEHLHRRDNTIPVVIMTGYPSLENTLRTLKNGVVDFLVKPVNLNQLELCLRRVLRERELFVENILLKGEVESKARLETLNRELTFKVDELRTLNRILSDISAVDASSDVFQRVVDMTRDITHAESARFFVINGGTEEPVQVAGSGAGEMPADGLTADDPPKPIELGRLLQETATEEVPLLVSRNNGSRRLPSDLRSFMAVPLKIRDKVFGVLTAAVTAGEHRFSEKDLYYLAFMTRNAARSIENLALYENIFDNLFSTLYAFVKALEARDRYTQQHSNRVTTFAVTLGRELGCSSEELDILNVAGRLHDVGKIGIRDDILLKPGRLTDEEFEKIKEHPVIGAQIVERLGLWHRERQIIRSHHERFDGNGYPDRLAGRQIPFLARILAVADAYDAMASDRAYRKRMPTDRILGILTNGAGSQWDPKVVTAFLELHREGAFASTETPADTAMAVMHG